MLEVKVDEELSNGWYLFMDLLAVQYLAQANPLGLFQNFRDFFEIILGAAAGSPKVKVYTLSDSAMVHSDDLDEILKFVRKVRSPLFQAGVFFKGGIAEGETSYFRAAGVENFHGVSFAGAGASSAYAGQSRLNSTDVMVVSREGADSARSQQFRDARNRGDIVKSIYYDPGAPNEYVEFSALALGISELGVKFDITESDADHNPVAEGTGALEVVLQNYWYAKHLDRRASAKFISLLIHIAIHSDYGKAVLTKEAEWKFVTPIFKKLFITSGAPSAFADPAFNVIYAVAVSKILRNRRHELGLEKSLTSVELEKMYNDPTVHKVLDTAFKRRTFMSSMKSLPQSVFKDGTGDLIFRLYGFRQQLIASNAVSRSPR